MRFVLLILALLTSPAFGQGWEQYDNGRYDYSIEVPPEFVGDGESDNGDGQSFYNSTGAKGLLVWGGNLISTFEDEAAAALDYAQAENGWNVANQTTTPRWADFIAVKGSRMLRQRMILLCDGASYAAFRVEYSVADITAMEPVIDKLVVTLRGAGC